MRSSRMRNEPIVYTHQNFKTKTALLTAFATGERLTAFQPGPFGDGAPKDGTICLEGPHYPAPHRWYASATLRDSVIVMVDGKTAAQVAARLAKAKGWGEMPPKAKAKAKDVAVMPDGLIVRRGKRTP